MGRPVEVEAGWRRVRTGPDTEVYESDRGGKSEGGVGKTTTVVNLGAALAQMGRKVVLVDLDPQAHLTTFVGADPQDTAYGSYDVLTDSVPLAEALLDPREYQGAVLGDQAGGGRAGAGFGGGSRDDSARCGGEL